jgi:hypothetical protein
MRARHKQRRARIGWLRTPILFVVAAAIVAGAMAGVAASSTTGSLAAGRNDARAVLLPDGKVLVAGGSAAAGGILTSAERYDPVAGTWSSAGDMATSRVRHTATLLPTGEVLAAGGFGGTSPTHLKSAELYGASGNAWAPASDMASIRSYHTATLLGSGRVLVAGGIGLTNGLTSAELYTPSSNSWAPAGALATGRYLHTATLLNDGRVLVAGGSDSTNHATATAERYQPKTNTWSAAGALTTARTGATATLLLDGRVLVAGGGDATGAVTNSAEVYDPAGNTWSSAGSMVHARYGQTATLLRDGRVLLSGGEDDPGNLDATSELYDPATNTWSAGPALDVAREAHTATQLVDGRVLLAGGVTDAGGADTRSELTAPAAPIASTRRPIIAYVNAAGAFSLYDAELGADIAAPPLPANLTRFSVSFSGRYFVYSHPATKHIHLYDRRSGSEVGIPGIDVYTNPNGLTVSDAGLIAFDDNSNGPSVAYDSVTRTFVDTGLAADNGHRQDHLSADGRFLATTCVSSCATATGGDADPFLQDLTAKALVPFPDDLAGAARDEEHPCIDGAGRLMGVDIGVGAQHDVYFYDRVAGAPLPVAEFNDPGGDQINCVLDRSGRQVGIGDIVGGLRLYDRVLGGFVPLPARVEGRVWFSDPLDLTPPETTITDGPAGPTASSAATFGFVSSEPGSTFECSLDGAAFSACTSPNAYTGLTLGAHGFAVRATDSATNVDPTPATRDWTVVAAGGGGTGLAILSGLRISPASFLAAPRGAAISRTRYGATVRYTLNVAAAVRFTVQRRATGRRSGKRCVKPTRRNRTARRCTRLVKVPGSFTHAGRAGANSLHFSGRLAARRLRAARYVLAAVPTGGKKRTAAFRIKRPRR